MKSTLCLFVCMMAIQLVNAQTSVDYYITENADTVFGEIKVSRGQKPPVFRKPGGEFRDLPSDAMRCYSSRMKMIFARFQTSPTASEFLVVEHDGPVKLYASTTDYYLIREGELVWTSSTDGALTAQERGQLTVIVNDLQKSCATISDKNIVELFADNGTMRKSTLLKILNRYNTCAGSTEVTVRGRRHFLAVQLFYGVSIIEAHGDDGFLYNKSGRLSSVNANISFRLRYGVPVFKDVMYVHVGYKVFKSSPSGSEKDHYAGTLYDLYSSTVNIKGAQIDIGLEYAIGLGGRFFLSPMGGGRIIRYSEQSIYTARKRTANGNIVYTQTERITNNQFQGKSSGGLFCGLGLHCAVVGNLTISAEVMHYVTSESRFHTQQFNTGILLAKAREFRVGMGYRFR